MPIYHDSWWHKTPTRCSCGRRLDIKVLDYYRMDYVCRVHGLAVMAQLETNRNDVEAWHFFRTFNEGKPSVQLTLC